MAVFGSGEAVSFSIGRWHEPLRLTLDASMRKKASLPGRRPVVPFYMGSKDSLPNTLFHAIEKTGGSTPLLLFHISSRYNAFLEHIFQWTLKYISSGQKSLLEVL